MAGLKMTWLNGTMSPRGVLMNYNPNSDIHSLFTGGWGGNRDL